MYASLASEETVGVPILAVGTPKCVCIVDLEALGEGTATTSTRRRLERALDTDEEALILVCLDPTAFLKCGKEKDAESDGA